MNKTRNKILNQCETLMLDMDGTVLDLSYDSHIWLKIIPEKLAEKRDIPITSAISFMNEHVTRMKNTLEWYCICLLYTSPSPRDLSTSRMPSSA